MPPRSGTAPLVAFCGGGFYLPWILGVASTLRKNHGKKLTRCVFAGASSGAFVAAIAACDVSCDGIDDYLVRYAALTEGATWGSFGSIVCALLSDHLPQDAHILCTDRLFVALQTTDGRFMFQSTFESKQDVIGAVLASMHVPYMMDGSFASSHRGGAFVDGAWGGSRDRILDCAPGARAFALIDHNDDAELHSVDAAQWWRRQPPEVWLERYAAGKLYGERVVWNPRAAVQRRKIGAVTLAFS